MRLRIRLLLLTATVPVAMLVIASALAPSVGGGLGLVRSWCVGGDEQPWRTTLAVVVPLAVVASLAWVSRREIADVARTRPQALVLRGSAIAGLTGLGVVALSAFGGATEHVVVPPVGSRPALDMPLVDQAGESCAISSLRGHVVLVTAVYSRCSSACPMTFVTVEDVLGRLTPEERQRLVFVAVTLDPANDTPARLAEIARGHGLEAPRDRLLTGRVADVGAALDALGIERRRNPETGVIAHDSVLIVLDRDGRVVARFRSVAEFVEPLVGVLREQLGSSVSAASGGGASG